MTVVRRFLVASSLARLVARDRGSKSITEGYFAAQEGRVSYVVVDGERSLLVLVSERTGAAPAEERTEIPRAHAEALLDVCAGRMTYERSAAPIEGGAEVLIDRITQPGVINTVTIEFHNADEAEAFTPPSWFGPEITTDPSFGRQVIALDRPPEIGEVPLSDAIVDAVLDLLEGRASGVESVGQPEPRPPSIESSVLDALRRLSTSGVVTRSTAPPEGHEASAEAPFPDIDAAEVAENAERGEVTPEDADGPSTKRSVRPRIFPRLTR